MAEPIVGAIVKNKAGEAGEILSFDENYLTVNFQGRGAITFLRNALEKGFLTYEDNALQESVDEAIAQAKIKEAAKLEAEKQAAERAKNQATAYANKTSSARVNPAVRYELVEIRLDPGSISLDGVAYKDCKRIKSVFAECDKETKTLYEAFKPMMVYPKITSYARSKYAVGFLCKYLDTYVFRVFSRHDVYKRGITTGTTVRRSNTTEILRVLYIDGQLYTFCKNFAIAMGYYINHNGFTKWRLSSMDKGVFLNEVILNCDCTYLNEYIEDKTCNTPCKMYTKLLMPALYNNKVEILFKKKNFTAVCRIDDIVAYLEEYSTKQIEYACKNNVIYALPAIKRYGYLEPELLQKLETLMRKNYNGESAYTLLQRILTELGLDTSNLDKKLLNFAKKVERLDWLYVDYIELLRDRPGVTLDDFFDKDYMGRYVALLQEAYRTHSEEEDFEYRAAASSLSWINRTVDDYYLIVPRSIEDFKYEGACQHNCVYTNAYDRRVVQKDAIILFLRKEKTVPFVTIELDYETFEIRQALGKYNTRLTPELEEYIENLAKELYLEKMTQ